MSSENRTSLEKEKRFPNKMPGEFASSVVPRKNEPFRGTGQISAKLYGKTTQCPVLAFLSRFRAAKGCNNDGQLPPQRGLRIGDSSPIAPIFHHPFSLAYIFTSNCLIPYLRRMGAQVLRDPPRTARVGLTRRREYSLLPGEA